MIVKNYPKNKQPIIQQQKNKSPNSPTCKQKIWLEIDKSYYCTNCENIINKHRHQIIEKVLRQYRDFSARLNYANKKIRENFIKMVNTKHNSTEDMINILQEIKGKTKLKVF